MRVASTLAALFLVSLVVSLLPSYSAADAGISSMRSSERVTTAAMRRWVHQQRDSTHPHNARMVSQPPSLRPSISTGADGAADGATEVGPASQPLCALSAHSLTSSVTSRSPCPWPPFPPFLSLFV